MKKVHIMILCAVLCLQMTACGLVSGDAKKEKWIEEGAAMLGDDVRSGEFVLDGEVYSFPMELSVWLDRGWHISNSYENKDEFELEPGYESNSFELFNDDDDYVRVAVFNVSDENASLEECLVSYLYLASSEDFELVLPAGINIGSKPEDILEAYGDDDVDDSDGSIVKAYYEYTTDDDWICIVQLDAYDNDYTINPVTHITYTIDSAVGWAEFYENTSGVEGCTKYIDTCMRTSFYGDFTEYVENKFDTQENAEALYESEVNYYASSLIYYAGINEEMLDEATVEGFREIARQVLAKTKWEITDLSIEIGGAGTLYIDLYPTNFLDLIGEDIENAISELQTKYANINVDEITESQEAEIEQDYAEMVLNAIKGSVDEIQLKDPVSKWYFLDYNNGIVTNDDWEEIDSIIMDLR